MARTLELHPGAAADAAAMADWYRRRSPPVAAALAAEILDALDQIEGSPLTFPAHIGTYFLAYPDLDSAGRGGPARHAAIAPG